MRNCSVGGPISRVRFDETGLRGDGYYCVYDAAADACYTDLVIYDGAGLKTFTGRTPPGFYCSDTDLTAAGYDGAGLVVVTVYRWQCVAA